MLNIITVVRNDLPGLIRTINSIRSQKFELLRNLIVVDGNSTDGTWNYLLNLKIPYLTILQDEPKGVYPAMNAGMDKLFQLSPPQTDHLIFLNAGDFFYNANSAEKIHIMASDKDFSSFSSHILDVRNFPEVLSPNSNLGEGDEFLNPCIFWLPHQGVVTSINLALAVGHYSNRYKIAGDYDWILRATDISGAPTLFNDREIIQMVDGVSNNFAYRGYQERIEIAKARGFRIIRLPKFIELKLCAIQFLNHFKKFPSATKEPLPQDIAQIHELSSLSPWTSYFHYTSLTF